ncbi:MAG: hypothetical protein AB7Y46_05260 [Armatimonadota bacterium]
MGELVSQANGRRNRAMITRGPQTGFGDLRREGTKKGGRNHGHRERNSSTKAEATDRSTE